MSKLRVVLTALSLLVIVLYAVFFAGPLISGESARVEALAHDDYASRVRSARRGVKLEERRWSIVVGRRRARGSEGRSEVGWPLAC